MSICQIYDLCADTLWLGRYGENGARDIAIDVSRWFADLGTEGTIVLVNWRPGEDDTPYNPNVTMDGSKVVWSPSSIDLAISGRGFAELRYYVGNALAKSKTFRTVIDRTPSEGTNPPSAAEDWLERMEDAAVTAQTASETAVSAAETAAEGAQAVAEALPTVTQAAQTATSAAATATNAATEAAASEEVASAAANAAQTASETATTASQTAVGSASTATTKAAQAVEAAATATTKASEATQAATTATANAQTSTVKASEATTAAATATSKATEATTAASTASTAATTATGAASTATSAASTATAAKTAAQTAQTGAETAQSAAESAAASVTASAEQIATNTADISAIKADLNTKVDLNGENQITPQNIQGVTVSGGNVLDDAERIYSTQTASPTDGYVTISSGNAIIQSSSNFCSFLIPVKPNTHYTANHSIRFAVLLKNLSTEGTRPVKYSTVIGSALANVTSFDTGEADHVIVSWSYNAYPINTFVISEGNTPTTEQTITLPDWLSGEDTPVVEKPRFATVTGNIASGGNLQLTAPRNNLRKGERIVFEGNITSFSALTIGLTYGTSLNATQLKNYFVIDGTNISYHATNTSTAITVAHGLTLSDNIQFIWEMSAVATCKITLISDGNLFVHEFTNFTRQAVGNPFVLSDGTVLTDCKLTWACNDIDKSIWMFGDSYFQYSENRWTYYLHQYGYDQNCLLDGFPGEGGVNGKVAFNNLLQFGTPKYAVWCLGMNDGSDSESAPASNWVTARDYFLQYCENNGVTPIFGTIPTVPTINHEQKNAWIRSSGYRYIDFAKAVGANANGVWYSGMLSSDGVHPTAQGARALFARVLLDLPEIMIGGYGIPTAINS